MPIDPFPRSSGETKARAVIDVITRNGFLRKNGWGLFVGAVRPDVAASGRVTTHDVHGIVARDALRRASVTKRIVTLALSFPAPCASADCRFPATLADPMEDDASWIPEDVELLDVRMHEPRSHTPRLLARMPEGLRSVRIGLSARRRAVDGNLYRTSDGACLRDPVQALLDVAPAALRDVVIELEVIDPDEYDVWRVPLPRVPVGCRTLSFSLINVGCDCDPAARAAFLPEGLEEASLRWGRRGVPVDYGVYPPLLKVMDGRPTLPSTLRRLSLETHDVTNVSNSDSSCWGRFIHVLPRGLVSLNLVFTETSLHWFQLRALPDGLAELGLAFSYVGHRSEIAHGGRFIAPRLPAALRVLRVTCVRRHRLVPFEIPPLLETLALGGPLGDVECARWKESRAVGVDKLGIAFRYDRDDANVLPSDEDLSGESEHSMDFTD